MFTELLVCTSDKTDKKSHFLMFSMFFPGSFWRLVSTTRLGFFFFLFKFRRSECRILACTIEMGSNGRDIYLFIYLVNVLSWNTGKSFVLMSEQLNAFIVIKCFICVSKSLNTYAWVTHQLQLQSLNLLLKSVPLGVRNNMLPWW